jgi:hypothetical protein
MNRIISMWTFIGLIGLTATNLSASTIIKLNLGSDDLPDIELIDGIVSTASDQLGATTGDQNTEVAYLGVLSDIIPTTGPHYSVTLSGVAISGKPDVVRGVVIQDTLGGAFSLYNPSNDLLLAGSLGPGTLTGPIGGTATGSILTTEFGAFTDGSLLPILQEGGLTGSTISFALTNVNLGQGLSLLESGDLADFQADAIATIGANVPEPGSFLLLLLGLGFLRRRRA